MRGCYSGAVPGGFNPRFELLEINVSNPDDDGKVLSQLWRLWNEGHRYYLSGGTDVHDVWNDESGQLRTYAHVVGASTAEATRVMGSLLRDVVKLIREASA